MASTIDCIWSGDADANANVEVDADVDDVLVYYIAKFRKDYTLYLSPDELKPAAQVCWRCHCCIISCRSQHFMPLCYVTSCHTYVCGCNMQYVWCVSVCVLYWMCECLVNVICHLCLLFLPSPMGWSHVFCGGCGMYRSCSGVDLVWSGIVHQHMMSTGTNITAHDILISLTQSFAFIAYTITTTNKYGMYHDI